jgi:hypothetical protein
MGAATRQLRAMAPLVAMALADTKRRIDDAVRDSRLRRERDYGPEHPPEDPRDR